MNDIASEDEGFFSLKDSTCVEDAEEIHVSIQLKDIEAYLFFQDKDMIHRWAIEWCKFEKQTLIKISTRNKYNRWGANHKSAADS